MTRGICCRALLVLLFVISLWALTGNSAALAASKPCAPNLSACSPDGCAPPGSTDALLNRTKRNIPDDETPIKLTFDDFLSLQDQATLLVDQKVPLDEDARRQLRMLEVMTTKNKKTKVSEGDLVEVAGYVTGLPARPKASGAESVNCRLSGSANNDFHIPLVSDPSETEFDGIVVEMIPQNRNKDWTTKKLKRIAREERLVIVRGQLFYDNEHVVNDNPDNVIGGQPKRASLWEIHPVTEFFVCMTANKKCGSHNVELQQWMRLEDIKEQ